MLNARYTQRCTRQQAGANTGQTDTQARYQGSALDQLCVQQHALMAGQQQVNKHTLAQAVRGKDCQVPLVSLVSNQNGS